VEKEIRRISNSVSVHRKPLFLQVRSVCFICILFSSLCGAEPTASTENPYPLGVDGSLRFLSEFEEGTTTQDDYDFSTYLRLELDPLFHEKASFYFYGRSRIDFDSESDIDDALEESDHRIFQSYLSLKDIPKPFGLRLGRQWIHEVEGVHLDGLRFDVKKWGDFDFMGFAGRPVSEYTSTDSEQVYGGEIRYRPFRNALFRLTIVRSDEDHPIIDDHIGIHWVQKFWNRVRVYGDYKALNRRSKDFRIGASTFLEPLALDLHGNYYRRVNRTPKPGTDDVEGRRFSEFYQLLGTTERLERYGFRATRYFNDQYAISGGLSVINILDKETPSHRESERYFLTFHIYNFLISNLQLSIDGNYVKARFDSENSYTSTSTLGDEILTSEIKREEEVFVFSGQLEYQVHKDLKVALGSSYGDYDFSSSVNTSQAFNDYFLNDGRDLLFSGLGGRFITRTYFAEMRWKIKKDLNAKILAEWDHSKLSANIETEDFARIVASVDYRF